MPKKQQKRSNGDGSIYYEKARDRWVCAIVDPSGKRVVKRFKTEQEAKDHLIVLKSSIITNTYIQPTEYTFGQWLIDYLKLYIIPYREPSTIRTYTIYTGYAEPISETTLQKLNTNTLQLLINTLPDKLSDNTKLDVAKLFKRALNKAVETRLIQFNPMIGVVLPIKQVNEIETFTSKETKTILTFLKNDKEQKRNYAIFSVAFATGMRIGEILALQQNDIHEDYISVTKTTKKAGNYDVITGATKGKKTRNITVPAEIISVLRSLTPNENGFLFYGERDKKLMCEGDMQYPWKCILRDCGIAHKKIHAIRHTHATHLLENGISITQVSKRLGHSRVTTTLNTYSHILKDDNKENIILDKVNEILIV